MPRAARLATLMTGLWLIAACDAQRVTRREPPLQRSRPECPAANADECRAQCGAHRAADPASPEGQCEAALGDLCRSRCAAACEAESPALRGHIAELESYLESRCGSGKPVEPGEPIAPRLAPTPHPLDDLMR
jgi:hypothetical protein